MKALRHLLTVTLLCGSAAFGQTGGTSGAAATDTSTMVRVPLTMATSDVHRPDSTRLYGRVAFDDGSAAPRGIAIEMICTTLRRTVASTDSKGEFTFAYGNGVVAASDASASGQRSANPVLSLSAGFVDCELRADLAGYVSEQINLTDLHATERADLGTLVLRRVSGGDRGEGGGAAVSITALNAPKRAREAYESGLKAARSGKMDVAAKEFERAVAVYPAYANAWLELGRARQQMRMTAAAREAWRKALEADPKLTGASVELGLDAGLSHRWEAATGYLDQALRMDPVDYPEAWFGDAVAHYYLGEYDEAEKCAREAVRMDAQGRNPRPGYVLGMVLARKGDREGAAAELRRYLKAAPQAADAERVKAQLAEIEDGTMKPESGLALPQIR